MSTKLATAFLDRVQRSGLVSSDEMPRVRQKLEERGVDLANANAIADALVAIEALTRWQADKVLEGKHKGFFLGSYRLLKPLGKGGMGAVFLAQHEMMRRQCAIKVLPHSQIKEGSSVLKRFYVEAQAVAALDHQNIVRAYDVNKESKDGKDIHYLVMEFVDGHDVQSLVQEQGLMDCINAAEYLRQTANGLAHAHENGLVHRDIKPANLLVDRKGVVKILDLGLARFFDDGESASLTTAHNETVLGTADYLSPEQALNSHTVDHRTDIYSLGCTAYFMLTGHPPFPEGSVAQRLVAHQVKMPEPITVERPDAPPDLAAIVEKMMAKNPDHRFQNAEALSAVLAKWLIEHGDDEWKRQHSEIVADRSLVAQLPGREPTRAISSALSETELELVPLDDEHHDLPGAGVLPKLDADALPPAPAVRKSKSGTRKSGPGSGARKSSPSSDLPTKSSSADSSFSEDSGAPPVDPSELAPLQSSAQANVPEENGLLQGIDLADFGSQDMLGTLDEVDLMNVAAADHPLGAMDSDLRQVTLSGSSPSVSKSHRQVEPTKNGWFGANAIGLPILIGSVGGLLVVLILLAIMFMSNKAATQRTAPTQRSVPGGSEFPDGPSPPTQTAAVDPSDEVTSESQLKDPALRTSEQAGSALTATPDSQAAVSDEPTDSDASPTLGQYGASVGQPAEPPAPLAAAADVTPQEAPAESPQARPANDGSAQATQDIVSGQPAPASPPDSLTQPAAPPEQQTAAAASPAEPEPAEANQSPQELLAALDAFKVSFNRVGMGRGKVHKDFELFLARVEMNIGRTTADTAEQCKMRLDPEAPAELLLELEPQPQPGGVIILLRGRLTAPDAAGEAVELWKHEQELARLTQRSNLNVAGTIARDGTNDFFTAFRKQWRLSQGMGP